jgi:hypothetical protein
LVQSRQGRSTSTSCQQQDEFPLTATRCSNNAWV